MYWKIIRVNGDGSLRLIYNGSGLDSLIRPVSLSENDIVRAIGSAPYNLEHNDPKYTGYTYDNGTDSFIKKEVDTWYNNTLGKNSAYDSKVILGRFCSDSSGYNYDGAGSFSSSERFESSTPTPIFTCPSTDESYGGSYRLKAGLITADELVFAGESAGIEGDSYLNTGSNGIFYSTMTPYYFNADHTGDSAVIEMYQNILNVNHTYWSSGIVPVINISTENMTLTGDGTIDNPYVLEEVAQNNYQGVVTIEEGSSIEANEAFAEDINLPNDISWTIDDSSIASIENNIITGLKEGTTTALGVGSDGTTYEIEIIVIKNPATSNILYIGFGVLFLLILGTILYIVYRKKKRKKLIKRELGR